jgi:hypothetical protein
VAMTAVALVVDGRCLLTADALLPHGKGTPARSPRLRQVVVAVPRR